MHTTSAHFTSSYTTLLWFPRPSPFSAGAHNRSLLCSTMKLLSLVLLSGLLLVTVSAASATYQFAFVRRPDGIEKSECFTYVNRTIVYKRYKLVNGLKTVCNKTLVFRTKICCQGFKLTGSHCMRIDTEDPCKALSCPSEPNAKCAVFKKCGHEIALFLHEGSVVEKCHDPGYLDVLSCSGVCVGDPCRTEECPAFNASEVICFTSGCDCQVTWIRAQDRAEVNCQTGAVLTKQESSLRRRKREACS